MSGPYRKSEFQKIFEGSLKSEPPQDLTETVAGEGGSLTLRDAVVGLVISHNEQGEDLQFLLTMRSDTLKEHPSQVALPGGLIDSGETHLAALDREVFEEVGIRQGSITWVKDHWDVLPSLHGIRVFPYVGFLPATANAVSIENDEVAAAAWVSLASLFETTLWSRRELSRAPWQWNGWSYTTWGLTAAFLALLVRRISGSYPS